MKRDNFLPCLSTDFPELVLNRTKASLFNSIIMYNSTQLDNEFAGLLFIVVVEAVAVVITVVKLVPFVGAIVTLGMDVVTERRITRCLIATPVTAMQCDTMENSKMQSCFNNTGP